METATHQIPAFRLPAFEEEVKRLARRAKRLGLPEPRVTAIPCEPEIISVHRTEGDRKRDGGEEAAASPKTWVRVVVDRVEVTLAGERPQLPGGWRLLGVVEWAETEDGPEAFLRMAPGEEAPSWARTARNRCDHCEVSRRRNTVILVQSEEGETRQIGSSCIEDCLPGVSLAALLAGSDFMELFGRLAGMDDWDGGAGFGGGGRLDDPAPEDYLSWAVQAARLHGWLGRTKAREWGRVHDSTADRASDARHAYYSLKVRPDQKPDAPTDEDCKTAREILAAVRELADSTSPEERGDYIHNLCVGCRSLGVSHRQRGIVASAVIWYERETEKRIARERKAARANGYIGTIKKREVFTLTLVRTHSFEGNYGVTWIYAFEDAEGRDVVWFASREQRELDKGSTYKIKGTVKKHEERKGRLQTHLTRCVVVEKIDAAA